MEIMLVMVIYAIIIVLSLFVSSMTYRSGTSIKLFLICFAVCNSLLIWTGVVDIYFIVVSGLFLVLGVYADE